MLLVSSRFFDLLIDQLLPCNVLSVGYLLLCEERRHAAKHVGTEGLGWMEALSFDVDRHTVERVDLGLLVLHLLRLLLHVDLRQVDLGVLRHLPLVLHGKRLLGLVLLRILLLLLLQTPILVIIDGTRRDATLASCIVRHRLIPFEGSRGDGQV